MATQGNANPSLLATIRKAFAQADSSRTASVTRVAQYHSGLLNALAVEQSRVAAKYGAGSIQARNLAIRLDAEQRLSPSIAAEVERSKMPAPAPSKNAFIVFGRTIDSNEKALRRVSIVAVASDNSKIGECTSDNSGMYQLSVKGDTAAADTEFQLTVSDPGSQRTFTDDAVYALTPGKIAYREIVFF
jgi:hypothetical protein